MLDLTRIPHPIILTIDRTDGTTVRVTYSVAEGHAMARDHALDAINRPDVTMCRIDNVAGVAYLPVRRRALAEIGMLRQTRSASILGLAMVRRSLGR